MPDELPQVAVPAIFVTSFLVGLTGALVPGPLFVVVVVESLSRGFWVGPQLVLGHALLELGIVAALALGLSRLVPLTPLTYLVGVAGGAYLLWMAWSVYRGAPAAGAALQRIIRGEVASRLIRGPRSLLVLGAVVSISNPYWLLWWAGLGSSYVLWALEAAVAGLAAFYLGHILSDFAWYGAVGMAITGGRQVMSQRVYQATLRACATFLAFLGGLFIYLALRAALAGGSG